MLAKLVAQGLRLKLTEHNTFSKDEVLGYPNPSPSPSPSPNPSPSPSPRPSSSPSPDPNQAGREARLARLVAEAEEAQLRHL